MTKFETINENYPKVYRISNLDTFIFHSPLSNCQTYSIAGVENILYQNDALNYFKDIQNKIKKNQVLIDISQKWVDKIKSYFPIESIKIESPYINSTGNRMVLLLFTTKHLS